MARVLRGTKQNIKLEQNLRRQMTSAEVLLWSRLRGRRFLGLKFRRQHGTGAYIVDFYCPEKSLVIEVDGDTHAEEIQMNKDAQRTVDLEALGLQVVRYFNREVLDNLEGVLEDLQRRVS